MKLHEYQAKDIFAEAGISAPELRLTSSVEEVMKAVGEIGYPAAIEAQVHVDGRDKAGGIKIATNGDEARQAAEDILGTDLKGCTISQVLVRAGADFENELYVGVTIGRSEDRPVAMVSTESGASIKEAAEENSGAITREHIDPAFGLHPYQARKAAFEAGILRDVALDMASLFATLYDLYESNGASDIKVNPAITTSDRGIVAAGAVMSIDDDALFRHDDLTAMKEDAYENDLGAKAGRCDFDYIRLSGNVGIIGNGAGFVMMTLDLVDYFGDEPANFPNIGGGAKAKRVASALNMIFSDENVDSVVFNAFGDITRGDEVAKGINEALESFDEIPKPVVVRLAGTNAEEGIEILNAYLVQVKGTLEDAVRHAVENAQEVSQWVFSSTTVRE